ncbi:MAG: tetratricopeptide repeat protein [Xanthomonadaceae bacterium]|nr:tetratricopeptide repeat protein [Xanthomonadaceae bacterium]
MAETARRRRIPATHWLGATALLGLVMLLYMPALTGGFLFDDFINLQSLGEYGGVHDFERLGLYLTGGIADPTGRPIALLSFLLDARDWPADPTSFKRTNLLIHLLNTLLLLRLLQALGVRTGLPLTHSFRAALLGTGLWAIHPLWVSTTMYVVQRHAMLPATFVLLALLLWEAAWRRLEANRIPSAWALGLFGVWVATACALLSKANGALTPLLVALVWLIVYRPRAALLSEAAHTHARRLSIWALLTPAAAVLLALLAQIPEAIDSAANHRSWPLWQRALSQPRALADYLLLLLAPRVGTGGVYADDFVVSTGLLSPWTTLPSIILIGAVAALGVWSRQRAPVLSVTILFFLTGHLVESSWLALEPYFEHRNYLPAILLFWPLAVWLVEPRVETIRRPRILLLIFLPVIWATLTWARATVWGDPEALTQSMAQYAPLSARAQGERAMQLARAGRHHAALTVLDEATARHPADANLALPRLASACAIARHDPKLLAATQEALAHMTSWTVMHFHWFERAISSPAPDCPFLQPTALASLLFAARRNTRILRNPGWLQDTGTLQGLLMLRQSMPEQASAKFNRSLELQPNPDTALRQAAMLGGAGFPELGLKHLQHYRECCWGRDRPARGMPRVHQWLKWRPDGYYEREFAHLTALLHQAVGQANEQTRLSGDINAL